MEAVTNINLKRQFLEIELIWVIHRSHRTYDWRDIISSEDNALVRITTNNYHMLSLCMECIPNKLFYTKHSSSLFANCDLFPSCTMDSKQPANNLMYSKDEKDIFGRIQRKLFPVWMRRNYNSFFPPSLKTQDTNAPSFSPSSYCFLTAWTKKLNYPPLRIFCNVLAQQG